MNQEIFEEMAQKVNEKVNEKIHSENYNPSLQFDIDVNKLRKLSKISFESEKNDLYFTWYLAELDSSEFEENIKERILRIMVMSATVAYLDFLSKYPMPEELKDSKSFEIFYHIYKNALKFVKLETKNTIDEKN